MLAYPTSCINGGPNRPVFQVDQFPDIVNVRVRTIRKHGAAARESEPVPVAFVNDPILNRLLHRQLLVRHIGVPRQIPAHRPGEHRLVSVWGWHAAFEQLVVLGTMPLSVYEPVTIEFQRPLRILTRRVLAELQVAGRVSFGFEGVR